MPTPKKQIQSSKKPNLAKNKKSKSLFVHFTVAQNQGINEKIDKILQDPKNYTIPDSCFDLETRASVAGQALVLGLNQLLSHPHQPIQDEASVTLANQVASVLFPKLDARLRQLFETMISTFLNEKETNLFVKNIFLILSKKLGGQNASINDLSDSSLNKNITLLIEEIKKQLIKDTSVDKDKK